MYVVIFPRGGKPSLLSYGNGKYHEVYVKEHALSFRTKEQAEEALEDAISLGGIPPNGEVVEMVSV